MALPEILLNSPTPGKREALTTLNVELTEAGLEMEWVANVPAELQKAGQYRVTIGSEIILCEGKAENTKKVKILERGAEGTTKVAHPATTTVWGLLTKGALKAFAEYKAKAAGGLELSGTEFLVEALGITNAMLAGSIAPSKVTGTAVVESEKTPATWPYLYKTGGSEKPAVGTFTTNNTTPNSVTKIWINTTEGSGHVVSEWFAQQVVNSGGTIEISYPGVANNFNQYLIVVGGGSLAGGVVTLTVQSVNEGGSKVFSEEARLTIVPAGVTLWATGELGEGAKKLVVSGTEGPQVAGARTENFGFTVRLRGAVYMKAAFKAGKNAWILPGATSSAPSMRPLQPVNVSIKRAKRIAEKVLLNETTTVAEVSAATCAAIEAALASPTTAGVLVMGKGIPQGAMVRTVNAVEEKVVLSAEATESLEVEATFAISLEPTMGMISSVGVLTLFDELAAETILFLDGVTYNTS